MHIRSLAAPLLTALALSLAPATAGAADPPAFPSRTLIPLGTALWYGCADLAQPGPKPLDCKVAPRADESAQQQAASYGGAATGLFDRFTPENEGKMLWTHPSADGYDLRSLDALLGYARAYNKQVRGHTLLFGSATPGWVTNPARPWTRETLLAAMTGHIRTLMTHAKTEFPGVVDRWDVVNEPFTDLGTRDENTFQRVIGDDWVEQAFSAARAADPDALLYLNEFNADVAGPRQQAVLDLVADFRRRGVPIDGVGLQMHLGVDGVYATQQQLQAVMAQYERLGLQVDITELDVLRPPGPDVNLVQRAEYATAAEACRQALNCDGLTVWGVADRFSWRGADQQATLLGAGYTPKVAYDAVRCRLADPRPPSGPWTPKACPVAPLTEPTATTTPPPPATGTTGTTGATGTTGPAPSTVPAPAPLPPATVPSPAPAPPLTTTTPQVTPPPAADPRLRIATARRTARTLRVTGTAATSGRVTLTFSQVVRGHTLRATRTATLARGRFTATLKLTGALARVSRGALTAKLPARPGVRAASVKRTVRR